MREAVRPHGGGSVAAWGQGKRVREGVGPLVGLGGGQLGAHQFSTSRLRRCGGCGCGRRRDVAGGREPARDTSWGAVVINPW